MSRGLVVLFAADRDLVPQRMWLDRLALMIPGPAATRWLLLADAACLVALGAGMRLPVVAVPAALAVGFVVLNALGMALTDFYLGLSLFSSRGRHHHDPVRATGPMAGRCRPRPRHPPRRVDLS